MARQPKAKVPERSPEDRFVDQFLIDRDAYQAALRVGVARINVKTFVKKWMSDPDILMEIQRRTDDSDLDSMITPQRIIAGFIDVAFDRTAPPASRNSSLRELATLKRMYPNLEEKGKGKNNVIEVPGISDSPDEWEAVASRSQAKLKADVRK